MIADCREKSMQTKRKAYHHLFVGVPIHMDLVAFRCVMCVTKHTRL